MWSDRHALVSTLVLLALVTGACAAIDAIVPPASGPCELTTLDPQDPTAAFLSGASCIIVTWDTSRFPSALVGDGGIGDPGELRAAALAAAYVDVCETTVSPTGRQDPGASTFATRFGGLTPDARAWAATLFLPAQDVGAGKGYCRDWLGIR